MKTIDMASITDNYEEDTVPIVTNAFESTSRIPKADGIDYLHDVNLAVQDIINLFKTTLENLDRSLSRRSNSATSSSQDDVQSAISIQIQDPREAHPGTSGNEKNGISKGARDFLNELKFLMDYTEKRINVSPTQQQEQDRQLRHAVRSSRKTEMDIKALNDLLSVQRMEHEKSIDKLNEELNECIKARDRRAEEIKNEIERIVNESELKMGNFYKESVVRQEKLKSEIQVLELRLKNLRGHNILMENELRDKRSKVETKLLNYLSKYDSKIGGRHQDMENYSKEFAFLNSQRKLLENDVMIDLRKTHDYLQQEKAEALQKILDERVKKFVRNRAARIIQKAWRAYWERHCAKKKKKSRKK